MSSNFERDGFLWGADWYRLKNFQIRPIVRRKMEKNANDTSKKSHLYTTKKSHKVIRRLNVCSLTPTKLLTDWTKIPLSLEIIHKNRGKNGLYSGDIRCAINDTTGWATKIVVISSKFYFKIHFSKSLSNKCYYLVIVSVELSVTWKIQLEIM